MLEENIKKVSIDIGIIELENSLNLYQKGNNHNLYKEFIENKEEKKHNMNSHTKWFNTKIRLNHKKEFLEEKAIINKWKVCMVDYGMNIGTEINGIRPSIIFKNSNYKYGEDIIVIPMTSYKEEQEKTKSIDEFDIKIKYSEENGLTNNSLIKIRQLKCISKKRLKTKKNTGNIIIRGEIEKELHDIIQTKVKIMLGI